MQPTAAHAPRGGPSWRAWILFGSFLTATRCGDGSEVDPTPKRTTTAASSAPQDQEAVSIAPEGEIEFPPSPRVDRDRGPNPFVGSQLPPLGSPPTFQPAAETLDLGSLIEGDVTEVWFWLRNGGSEPLRIDGMRPSCKCTVPTLIDPSGPEDRFIEKGQPIPGGAVFLLRAEFDSLAEVGDRKVHVQMFTNDPNQPQVPLTFRIEVQRWYDLEPPALNMPAVVPALGGECTVRMTTRNAEPLTFLPRPPLAPGLSLIAERVAANQFDLSIRVEPFSLPQAVDTQMTLFASVGDPVVTRPLRIPVHLMPSGETVILPNSIDFGEFPSAAGARQTVQIRCFRPDFVFTATEPSLLVRKKEWVRVTSTPVVDSDVEGVDLEVEILAGCPAGTVSGAVMIETNLEAEKTLRIPFTARVQ